MPATRIDFLAPYMPDWLGLWFSVFPTVKTLLAQMMAATLVIGSYFVARKSSAEPAPKDGNGKNVSKGKDVGAPGS